MASALAVETSHLLNLVYSMKEAHSCSESRCNTSNADADDNPSEPHAALQYILAGECNAWASVMIGNIKNHKGAYTGAMDVGLTPGPGPGPVDAIYASSWAHVFSAGRL